MEDSSKKPIPFKEVSMDKSVRKSTSHTTISILGRFFLLQIQNGFIVLLQFLKLALRFLRVDFNPVDEIEIEEEEEKREIDAEGLEEARVAVIEEQKREAEEKADEEEAKPSKADPSTGATSKSDGSDGKPDINDIPVEETQAMDEDQSTPQELNETSLDLNLGLKAHDGDRDSSSKPEDPNKVQLERVSSGGVGTSR